MECAERVLTSNANSFKICAHQKPHIVGPIILSSLLLFTRIFRWRPIWFSCFCLTDDGWARLLLFVREKWNVQMRFQLKFLFPLFRSLFYLYDGVFYVILNATALQLVVAATIHFTIIFVSSPFRWRFFSLSIYIHD